MATTAIALDVEPVTTGTVIHSVSSSDVGSDGGPAVRNRSSDIPPPRRQEAPRRPRLQHLRDRLSSPQTENRTRSDPEDSSDTSASPRRPRLRHRFSRSLTSLAAARTYADQDGRAEEDESPLAKWRARSKAKLVRAFTPSLEDRSAPAYPPAAPSASRVELDAPIPRSAAPVARAPSRNRSHSAPLLLTRPTELVAPAPAPAQCLSILVTPVSAHASDLGGTTTNSPAQSPFHTCPSSPWADATFGILEPDPCSASSDSVPAAPIASSGGEGYPVTHRCLTELPREVQLEIFRAVLEVCEGDWRRAIGDGEWVGEVARQRWSDGRANGKRELVKLGRVCKLWRELSLDGQLWADAPSATLLGPDSLTTKGVDRVVTSAGGFLTSLDARGLGPRLDWKTLVRIVEVTQTTLDRAGTRLGKIDLTGCTALTAASLSTLLSSSPVLVEFRAPGLRCLNEGHMRVLGANCPRLAVLDVTRCTCLAAAALLHLQYPPPPSMYQARETSSPGGSSPRGLRALKAGGLSGMNDFVVDILLDRHSWLETFDVSFSRLHDDAFKTLVALPSPGSSAAPPASGPSQMGRSPSAVAEKRTFPALKHLCLTGCTSLTSVGLGHLAGALPNLEILEIARFGVRARTDGIARLLASCPKLRRVDLEDNHELGDDAMLAFVPSRTWSGAPDLEHLVISACPALTDEAIRSVVENASKLRVLEADGTTISDRTARLFIRLARDRAAVAQSTAVEGTQPDADDPLIASRRPAVLSVLDNRTTGRRLSRDIGAKHLRPREGQRGYWTRTIGDYHDDAPPLGDGPIPHAPPQKDTVLGECDPTRVVVRSFHSSLAVDAADAARRTLATMSTSQDANDGKLGTMRLRSLSDSEVFRRGPMFPYDDNVRTGCTIS